MTVGGSPNLLRRGGETGAKGDEVPSMVLENACKLACAAAAKGETLGGLARMAKGDVTLAAATAREAATGSATGSGTGSAPEGVLEAALEAKVEASNPGRIESVDTVIAAGCMRLFLRDPAPKRLLGGAVPNRAEASGTEGRLTGEPLMLLPAALLLAVLKSVDCSAETAGMTPESKGRKEP